MDKFNIYSIGNSIVSSISYQQFNNNFGTLVRTLTLLDVNGHISVPGNIIINSGHIEFTRNSNQPMGNSIFPTILNLLILDQEVGKMEQEYYLVKLDLSKTL